jgi:hypothetical protein
MVFNATFNNVSVISWLSVLLVEETGGPGENHRLVASHWQTLSHYVVHLTLIGIRTHNISGNICTDCIYSCKSNNHRITVTTAPSSISTFKCNTDHLYYISDIACIYGTCIQFKTKYSACATLRWVCSKLCWHTVLDNQRLLPWMWVI